MSKPLPTQNTFTNVPPPWSLTNLDSNFTNVWAAINDVGTYSNTFIDTGAVNALVVTPAAGTTMVLTQGLTLLVLASNTNTSSIVTLNANGTGAKSVLYSNGLTPTVGAIAVGGIYLFAYDGTNWRLLNPSTQFDFTVLKIVNTSRSNTVTPAADPDLNISLPTAGTYRWEAQLFATTPGATGNTPGIQIVMNYSGTFTPNSMLSFTNVGYANGIVGGLGNYELPIGYPLIGGNTLTGFSLTYHGSFSAASPGIFGVWWSQNLTSVNATTLLLASYLKVTQMR